MENSHRFFENTQCEYYPCHRGAKKGEFNCLFCFCPLYPMDSCPGNPTYTLGGVKDCSNCLLPHNPGGYDRIMAVLYSMDKKTE